MCLKVEFYYSLPRQASLAPSLLYVATELKVLKLVTIVRGSNGLVIGVSSGTLFFWNSSTEMC